MVDVNDNVSNQCKVNLLACIDSEPNFLDNIVSYIILVKHNPNGEQISIEEGLISNKNKNGLWRYSQKGMTNIYWTKDNLRHGK